MREARAGRAQLLFLLIKPVVSWRFRSRLRRPRLRSLLKNTESPPVGVHLKGCRRVENPELSNTFSVPKGWQGKVECLINEMLFIRKGKPKLNTQSD